VCWCASRARAGTPSAAAPPRGSKRAQKHRPAPPPAARRWREHATQRTQRRRATQASRGHTSRD
jgi:hypothetical protein